MLAERIAEARKRKGITQIDLAVAMGDRYDSSMISQLESGKRSIRLDGLANAAQELRVSTDYLLGLTDDPTPAARLASELDAYRGELGSMPQPLSDPDALGEDDLDSRYVPVLEVATAAGNGRLLEGEHVTGHLAFQRSWLKRHSIDAAQCTVIGVEGDSMEPTLPDGCSILVDHSRRSRRKGRIYVIQGEDGLIVKRAGREKSGWQLISDNPYWPPATWPDGARIVGEVRWSGRTF